MSNNISAENRLISFVAGNSGEWMVTQMKCIKGEPLPLVQNIKVLSGTNKISNTENSWVLQGIRSNERYVTAHEKALLVSKQAELGRPQSLNAALIPIRKTASWWQLAQDERREIMEMQSKHIETGMKYLPAIARRLLHCRDLSSAEPFDFLTWFEFSELDSGLFDELLVVLRSSREWEYVDREIDIRLVRIESAP